MIKRIIRVFRGLFLLAGLVIGTAGLAQAKSIGKESDCRDNPACIEEYKGHKTAWMECLEKAGLSEKKRGKLAAKVEMLGIRNLKKQEFLIFNAARKACHKQFQAALANLETDVNKPLDWPSPLDNLTDRLPRAE